MKSFIVLALFVAAAAALPVDDRDAVITKFNNDNIGVDGYAYGSETSNGIQQQESGSLKNVAEGTANQVRGSFSYTGPDGVVYSVSYIADENGFQPTGAHIPQP